MEKYSPWNDPGTGINPFVPFKSRIFLPTDSFFVKLPRALLGIGLVLFRFPCLLLVLVYLGLVDLILFLLPVAVLRRPVQILLQRPGAYGALVLLGFYSPTLKYGNRRRLRLERGVRKKKGNTPAFGEGVQAGRRGGRYTKDGWS